MNNKANETKKLLESFKENPKREEDMKLLADAFYEAMYRGDCEYGGWGLDDKRPFGNSSVVPDIAEIIGWDRHDIYDKEREGYYDEDKEDYLNHLYDDLGCYLRYRWEESKKR